MTAGFSQTGLALQVFQPLLLGTGLLADITNQITSYTHEKAADNYYQAASFSMFLSEYDLQDWFLNGLGRHIEVSNPAGRIVWEGFINHLAISIGNNTYDIGPLMDIGNRAYAVYTPYYLPLGNQVGVKGTTAETTLANNSASQALYGIIEKALQAGECLITPTMNEADYLRDVFLTESAYPQVSVSYSFGAAQQPSITVDCVGYWRWLDAYVYNNRATTAADGWVTTNTKIIAALNANPNSFALSTDQSLITTNTAITFSYEKDNKTALAIIKAAAAAGDPSGNRWLFGVGQGRKAYFKVIPSTIFYDYKVKDNEQTLQLTNTDTRVDPWDIEPGQWFNSVDWFIGRNYASVYVNPMCSFIESVKYTAPYGFELVQSRINTLAQILAYKGLGGI